MLTFWSFSAAKWSWENYSSKKKDTRISPDSVGVKKFYKKFSSSIPSISDEISSTRNWPIVKSPSFAAKLMVSSTVEEVEVKVSSEPKKIIFLKIRSFPSYLYTEIWQLKFRTLFFELGDIETSVELLTVRLHPLVPIRILDHIENSLLPKYVISICYTFRPRKIINKKSFSRIFFTFSR